MTERSRRSPSPRPPRRPFRRRVSGLTALATAAVLGLAVVAGLVVLTPGPADAQLAENPKDPSGIAIPHPRVRLIHSTDPRAEGTSAHLRATDPFLFYQTGRDLMHRQFQLEHGIYGQPGSLSVPLYVGSPDVPVHGSTARFARDHSSSCGMCHSSLYREPSAGQSIASTGGQGRNTPHFFGAGLIEMIGEQIRAEVLYRYDRDGDGLIGRDELAELMPVEIVPAEGVAPVDYGDMAPGPDGVPQLNTLFRLWYVDAEGRVLADAFSLADERVDAFGFVVQPFGWGRGSRRQGDLVISQGGESTTVREFYTVAADFHMGLQTFDPTQLRSSHDSKGFGGIARVSLNGSQQYDFGGSVDRGLTVDEHGISQDDPDGDGHLSELTEGDVDAVEFYLLHTPPPAVRGTEETERGRVVLNAIGCTRCHVESWRLHARDPERGYAGDRRFFHLDTWSEVDEHGVPQVVGALRRLDVEDDNGLHRPAYGEFLVERLYSDLRHWDIGPEYWERRFDGTLQKTHRTAPLWGVGSTAPYGHHGKFLTLHRAIAAHGGSAQAERDAYMALPEAERERLQDYLRTLVLYSTDEIPVDIDGDGARAESYRVADRPVGYERFDARFLFETPPRYENLGNIRHPSGRLFPYMLIENVDQAYGLDLEYRRDSDGDGFPDRMDPTPEPPEPEAAEAEGSESSAPASAAGEERSPL